MNPESFYYLGDPVDHIQNITSSGFLKGEVLTLVVARKELQSIRHKINRIEKQEQFKRAHRHQFESLTHRENEILGLVATGLNNPQIAEKLFISRRTVEQHRKNFNRKLSIKSISHLVAYALAFDLL